MSSSERTIIAQVVYVAKPFYRKLPLRQGEKQSFVEQQRRSQIVAGFDENTGETVFVNAEDYNASLDELPHRRVDHSGVIYDAASCKGPTPANLRRRKTSRPWVSVEEGYRQRGGTGEQVSKKGGWLLGASPAVIAGENHKTEDD